jgi:hypothetical protein
LGDWVILVDAQVDWPNKFQGGSVPAAKKK